MFKGGIADKLGNRYEAKWLVYKLLHVLAGDYDALRFEGIDDSFVGFEFSIRRGDTNEWHQTKITAPNGNWTIRALKREKLLDAFAKKLSISPINECHFVSQDSAKSLREISGKARISNSVEEFKEVISSQNSEEFQTLQQAWKLSEGDTWSYLKRIFVTVQPEQELLNIIAMQSRYLLDTEDDVFSIFREFMETRFNKEVSTEEIKQWISQTDGIEFKAWLNPKSIHESLQAATDLYLSTYTPFGLGGQTLLRSQAGLICEEIYKDDGANTLILSGVAGAGKSGVLREIINNLHANSIPILSFRVDQHLDKRTSIEIGRSILNRDESPVIMLKGIAPRSPSVLIIDQLDAVSEVSGRDGLVKSAVFELIQEANLYGNVKVIIACRSYDLENDDRFRVLSSGYKTQKVDLPLLDWETETHPLLERLEFSPKEATLPQQQLLSVPINLAVFIDIDERGFNFRSQTELLAKLLEKKQRILTKQRKNWTIFEALAEVSLWMSNKQALTAPVSILDKFSGAVDWLASENLIIVVEGNLNFFHESLFDYVYARSFISGEKTTLELLLSSEQHLFRRTQIRQIFTMMRDADFDRYLVQLKELLSSAEIRFHLKLSIAQWLAAQTDPTAKEFEIVKTVFKDDELNLLERTIFFQGKFWFPLLNSKGIPAEYLKSTNELRQRITRNWLSNIAGSYPNEVAQLMREWWANKTERAEVLIDWFGFVRRNKPDDSLLRLCEDVIDSRPPNLFNDNGRDRVIMLLNSWVEHNPEKCGGMVTKLFEAWFEMHPDANLLDRDDFKLLDSHSLGELAKKSPRVFVEGTVNAILRTIQQIVAQGEKGPRWYNLTNSFRSEYLHGFDGLFQLFEKCLCGLAVSDSEIVQNILDVLSTEIHTRFVGLHLSVITANPADFGKCLIAMLNNDDLLEAGFDGAKWSAFACAAKSVLEANPELTEPIENYILNINHEIDRAKSMWDLIKKKEASEWVTKDTIIWCFRNSGNRQWNILRKIGIENLSSQGKLRLSELDRKFGINDIERENPIEMVQATSPISKENCGKMSDEQWLRAIKKYDNDDDRDWRRGGTRELVNIMFQQAKEHPDRFLNLFMQMPETCNLRYFSGVLRGVKDAPEVNINILKAVIFRSHQLFKDELSEEILSLIEKHTELILDDAIKAIVFEYVVSGESPREKLDSISEHSEMKILSVEDLVHSGGRMIVRSVFGGRSKAWETIRECCWKHNEILEEVWNLIERHATEEPSINVRANIFEAMIPLFNDDKLRYEKAVRILTDDKSIPQSDVDPVCILATYQGIRMHKYIDFHLPELASELISRLINCGHKKAQLIGWWWAFCERYRHNRSGIKLKLLTDMYEQEKVLLADITADAFHWSEYKNESEALLLELFADENEKVVEQATDVFRHSKAEDFSKCRKLAVEFVKTKGFLEKPSSLLYALDQAQCDVLNIVVTAAQKLLKSLVERGDQHGGRGIGLYKLQDLLAREYASSERNPEVRKQILDLIDYMLEQEIYGVDKIIAANDR